MIKCISSTETGEAAEAEAIEADEEHKEKSTLHLEPKKHNERSVFVIDYYDRDGD